MARQFVKGDSVQILPRGCEAGTVVVADYAEEVVLPHYGQVQHQPEIWVKLTGSEGTLHNFRPEDLRLA